MKTLLTLAAIALLCGCANEHTLVVRDWDPHNNRVDEKGNLIPWTNWGIGFWENGTNWVPLIQAKENP